MRKYNNHLLSIADSKREKGVLFIKGIISSVRSIFQIPNYNALNSKPEQPAYANTLRWASVLRLDIIFKLLFLPGLFLFRI
jgi:hypothetical protein